MGFACWLVMCLALGVRNGWCWRNGVSCGWSGVIGKEENSVYIYMYIT